LRACTAYRFKESLVTEFNTVCNPESVYTAAWTFCVSLENSV